MPFLRKHWTLLALAIVLLVGGYMRLVDPNFDQSTHQHPDERAISGWIMSRIQFPFPPGTTLADLLDPLKSPINMRVDPGTKVPQDMHYGTLPFYIVRVAAVNVGNLTNRPNLATDYDGVTILGRSISGVFDLFTVFLVFLIGRRLYGKTAGLLAATFSALAVTQIQVAHFMIAEPYLVMFLTAALYFSVVLMQNRRAWAAALAGLMLGFALACKVSVAFMALLIVAALVLRVIYQPHTRRLGPPPELDDPYGLEPATRAERLAGPRRAAFRAVLLLILAGLTTLAGFTLGDPLGVLDSGLHINFGTSDPNLGGTTFLHLGSMELWAAQGKYLYQLGQEAAIQNGSADVPFTRQYIGTIPVLYPFQNLIQWGMGPASGLVALAGLLWAFRLAFRRRRPAEILLLAGMIPYFLTIVNLEAKWLRYMLPLVPYMCVLAGGLLVSGLHWSAAAVPRLQALRAQHRPALLRLAMRRWVFPLVTAVSVVGSLLWAIAFMNIYTQDESRVQASRWMDTHLPANASYGHETWDDELPFGVPGAPSVSSCPGPHCISMGLYDDRPSPDEFTYIAGLLDQTDYIVPASNRLYDSIPRLPWRYPVQIRYYQLLFAGKLGFDKIYEKKVYPELSWLGIRFDDSHADESFTVYDHPTVTVFKKVRSLSQDDLHLLFGSSLDRPSIAVRHLESKDPGNYDKSLMLPQPTGQQIALADAAWNPLAQNQWVATLLWLLLIELIGWLAWPLIAIVCRRLPDRGFPLAKTLGLVVVAWITWMTASLRLFPFTAWSILLGLLTLALLSAILWRSFGSEIRAYMRTHRRLIVGWEALFLVAFAFFLYIRLLNPDSWNPTLGGEKPMELGFLNSVLRSPWMPPGDPFFSGGYINYYYYGWFLLSILIKGIGVSSAVGFNLSLPLLYGLTVLGAASIVYNAVASLQRARGWRGAVSATAFGWGLGGAVLLVGIGNLDFLLQALSMKFPELQQQVLRLLGLIGPLTPSISRPVGNFDYWGARSIIDGTINEFPYWTFLFADLHPHLIDMSISVLALGLIFNMLLGAWRWPQFRRLPGAILAMPVAPVPAPGVFADTQRGLLPTVLEAAHRLWGSSPLDGALRLFVVSLSLGTLFAVNSWDFPVYLVVLFAVLLVAVLTAWHSPAVRHGVVRLGTVVGAVIGLGLAAALGIVWYAPFILNFKPFYNQIKLTQPQQSHTQLPEFLVIWGLFVFIGFTYLALRLRQYPWGAALDDWRRWLHLGDPTPSPAFAAPLPPALMRSTPATPLTRRSLARVTLAGDHSGSAVAEPTATTAAVSNGHTDPPRTPLYAGSEAAMVVGNGHSDGAAPPAYAHNSDHAEADTGHAEVTPALVSIGAEHRVLAEHEHALAPPMPAYAHSEHELSTGENGYAAEPAPDYAYGEHDVVSADNAQAEVASHSVHAYGESSIAPAATSYADAAPHSVQAGGENEVADNGYAAAPATLISTTGDLPAAVPGNGHSAAALLPVYTPGETDALHVHGQPDVLPVGATNNGEATPGAADAFDDDPLARSRREWLAAMDDYEYAAPAGHSSTSASDLGFRWEDTSPSSAASSAAAAGEATAPNGAASSAATVVPPAAIRIPQAPRGLLPAGLGVPILALTVVVTGLLVAGGHALPALLALLIGGLIGTHFGGVRAPGALLGGLLLTVGFAIAMGVEYVYLADHLQGGDQFRMNTVFKFYEQVWVLVAAGGAIALYTLLGPRGSARRGERPWFSAGRAIWLVPFGVLLAGSLLFTVAGTQARVADRMPGERPPVGTLNAMDWMNTSTSIRLEFGQTNGTLIFRFERPALDWMNAHITGTPVVAAAPVGYYRESGMMVGTYTGLPMVVGGLHQDEQRYGWEVGERRSDMDQFYQTEDISRTLLLINKYDIEYIYVGGVEHIRYGHDTPAGLAKFDAMSSGTSKYLEKVFDEGNHVVVYHVISAKQVKSDLGAVPGTVFVAPTPLPKPTEPPLGNDPVLNELLKTLQGDPNNLDAHHKLADYYRDHGAISKAIDQYIEIVRLTPADVPAHHLLGDLYMQEGDRDKALAAWEDATKTASEADKPAAFNKVGIAYLERQRFDDAINAFKAVTASDHQYAEGWFHLGEAYQSKGDTTNARDAFTSCIQNARPDDSGKHWADEAKRRLDNLR